MSDIEKRAREKAEALIGEVLTAALSAGEITVNQARAVNAALEAALTPPEGYVLVPVEPTEGMVLAAKLFQGDHDNVDNWLEWEGVAAANQYRAMLAARPEAP